MLSSAAGIPLDNSRGLKTIDCSGEHEVMARQIRPWLAHPALDEAPRVRASDRGANQQTPSETAAKSRNQSSDARVPSSPSSSHELSAWQTRASTDVQPWHLDQPNRRGVLVSTQIHHGHMDTWTHRHFDTLTLGHLDTWTLGHFLNRWAAGTANTQAPRRRLQGPRRGGMPTARRVDCFGVAGQ
jgi:hypothetical protein